MFLQRRKERPRQTPSSPSTTGHFLGGYPNLAQWESLGKSAEAQTEMENGVGLTATNTQTHPILTCSSGILARGSAHLQLKHLRNFIVDRWSVLQLDLTMSWEINGFNHVCGLNILWFSWLFSF